jgi:sulfate transport system ATP-binding protein
VGGANVLRGHVQGGRVTVGAMAVSTSAGHAHPDGAAVDAYVRPHDVTLTKVEVDGPTVSAARVERLVRLGAKVKISLRLSDGAPMTVEMPKIDLDALAIAEGDLVMANLRDAKIFVADYSI